MELNIGFEDDKSFEIGLDGNPRYVIYPNYDIVHVPPTYWKRGGWFWTQDPGWARVEPELQTIHSGLRSAKLSLRDNITNNGRIEILHDYDPLHDFDLWNEVWYYLPSSVFHDGIAGGATLHRIIYERLWAQDLAIGYQQANINLGIWHDQRSGSLGQWMFLLGIKGSFDNDNDGVEDPMFKRDLYSNDPVYDHSESWNLQKVLVPFDMWFKIKTFVKRNLQNFSGGHLKVWINLNDGFGDRLIWDLYNLAPPTGGGAPFPEMRTVGIDPQIMTRYPDTNPGAGGTPPYSYGFLCAGFGMYSSSLDPGGHVYIDDVKITKGEYAPTPESPLHRVVDWWNGLSNVKKGIVLSVPPSVLLAALFSRRG